MEEVDGKKINDLGRDVKDLVEDLIIMQQEKNKKISESKNLIEIVFCLAKLGKNNYTSWDDFLNNVDKTEWREKNNTEIENLANALGCTVQEVNAQKISDLGRDVKDLVEDLIIMQQEKTKELNESMSNILKENGVDSFEKLIKMNKIYKKIDSISVICRVLRRILKDNGNFGKNTTLDDINKIATDIQAPIDERNTAKFLSNVMKELNTSNVDQVITKIDN